MADLEHIEDTLNTIRAEQAGMREQIKGALHRIDEQSKLVNSVSDIAISVKLLAQEVAGTKTEVAKLRGDVDEIKTKPAKRWDSVVSLVITALVTAMIGYLIGQVGLK